MITIEIIKRWEVLKRALFALVCFGLSFGIKAQSNERYKSLNYYFEEPISSDSKFRVEDETIDKLGIKHITFQQLHNGIIVQDAILKFHYRKQNISISGKPKVIHSVSNGNLQLNEAMFFAKTAVKGKYREDYETSFKPREPQRVIVETEQGFEECFKIDVYTLEPLARKDVYVGTLNGNIIRQDNRIHFADATGSAITKYSGVQTIITDSVTTDTFRLRDSGRNVETYNMEQGWFGNGIDFIDDDNSWNNVNVAQDEVATDAHWASEMFYDYLLNEHGRNSYDNAGDTLITKVHYGNNYGSAFWDGTSVTIGDGDGATYGPLTTVDIISHEFTHGVIEHTANLISQNESGALGESFADIFATAVEFYAKPGTANWTIKEDAHLSGGAERSLADPNIYGQPDTYQGTNWNFNSGTSPIYVNNGVQNYWFYLLVNGGTGTNDNAEAYSVAAIGIDDAMAIVYRSLTVYHTSTSTFADARNYSIQAAEDLFGQCTQEVISVINAWHAVGVGPSFNNSDPEAGFYADQVFSCYLPVTINFVDTSTNAVTYKWYFGDGDSSDVAFPSHTYTAPGTYTVTQIVTGTSCSNPDTMELVNYITVSASGGPSPALCLPTTTAYCCGRGISNVVFGSINNASGDGSDSYQDYSCTEVTTEVQGDNVSIAVSTGLGSAEDVRVWIDFNNDGVFNNTNELVFSSDNIITNHIGSVYIEPTAILNTPLRMRVASDLATNDITDACNAVQYGQVEDYTLTIIAPTGTPVVDFSASPTNVVSSSFVNFTNLTTNGATSYSWSFNGGTPSNSTALNPSIQYNSVGSYDVKLVATNSFGSDSTTKFGYINVGNEINMCNSTITSAGAGTFYDSGGPTATYQNNEDCGLLIEPVCASSVEITFSLIDFPSSADRLRIYDGMSNSDPLLETIGGPGQPIPALIVSTNGYIYLEFTSDFAGQYDGWTGHWTSIPTTAMPSATFATSDNNPSFGDQINFTDQTTNNPNLWNWDFGDGNTSSDQNPQHTYSSVGNYTVTLISANCVGADTGYTIITVQDMPVMTYSVDSVYGITSNCSDTLTSPIVIYNTGTGNLDLNYNTTVLTTCPYLYIEIETNNWATEISWDIQDDQGNILISGGGPGVYSNNSFYYDTIQVCGGNYTFNSYDSFGDGWNGGTYSVSTSCEGSVIVDNGGVSPAGNGQIEAMGVTNCVGTCPIVTVEITTGTWATEISWDLQDDQGNVVLNGGGTGVYADASVYIESIELCEGIYTFNAYDDFGDGWNGGTYQITTSCNGAIIANNGGAVPDNGVPNSGVIQTEASEGFFLSDCYETYAWNEISSSNAIVPNGDSIVIDVNFYSAGLGSGIYYDTLYIESNDTTYPELQIPLTFELFGMEAAISFADTCLIYDSLPIGVDQELSMWIYNGGCQDLLISNVLSPNADYSLVSYPNLIESKDSAEVVVNFSPNSIGTSDGLIMVQTNVGDSAFCFSGYGLPSPIININVSSVQGSISDCENFISDSIIIYNTGSADLIFTSAFSGSPGWVMASSYNDTIAPTDSLWIILNFDLSSLGVGSFSDALIFSSNDSVTPILTLPISLNVLGYPCADFSVISSICLDTVSFTDQTSNNPTEWFWDFGDGGTATVQNPIHVYNSTGAYHLQLIASNGLGADTFASTIVVDFANASFSHTGSYFSNDYVLFTSTSVGASAWNWNFGNSSFSVNPNDSSLYTSQNNYTIQLTITSDSGCVDSTLQIIQILDVSPVPGFDYYVTDSCGFTVAFQDTSIGGAGTDWMWDFGDGSSDTLQNPTHTYDSTGQYIVNLTVSNPFGVATVFGSVDVQFFEADFSITGDLLVDSILSFIATPNSINNYSWNFGEGGFSVDVNPSYSYSDTGAYTVSLIAISAAGCQDVVAQDISIGGVINSIQFLGNSMGVVIYPNPNEGEFVLLINGITRQSGTVSIQNSLGQIIETKRIDRNTNELKFIKLSAGVYFANISIDGKKITQKIVVN